jgi:hypothetical protein
VKEKQAHLGEGGEGVKRIIKRPVEPINIAAFHSSLRCALARCGTQSAT